MLPSSTAEDYNETLNNNFKQFNDNLQSYSNFTQAVGKVKFINKKPKQLTVDLPIDYYGQAETIGITQYVTEQAENILIILMSMKFASKMVIHLVH